MTDKGFKNRVKVRQTRWEKEKWSDIDPRDYQMMKTEKPKDDLPRY